MKNIICEFILATAMLAGVTTSGPASAQNGMYETQEARSRATLHLQAAEAARKQLDVVTAIYEERSHSFPMNLYDYVPSNWGRRFDEAVAWLDIYLGRADLTDSGMSRGMAQASMQESAYSKRREIANAIEANRLGLGLPRIRRIPQKQIVIDFAPD